MRYIIEKAGSDYRLEVTGLVEDFPNAGYVKYFLDLNELFEHIEELEYK